MSFLRKKIINFEEKCFGIDLSDLSVKIVQLENNDSLDSIRAYSFLPIPDGCIEDGKIINKQKIAETIRLAIKKAAPKTVNTKKAICSLPESKVFLRVLSIPKIGKEEISEAIKWEIEASIPLSVDQVYYDWQIVGEVENKQNVLTVAVSREVIDDLLDVLKIAKLEAYGMETESTAVAKSLISENSSKKETSLIIDLGAKRTNFIVVEGNIPFFTSSVSFSSIGVTESIAKAFKISSEEAEKMKISQGIIYSREKNFVFDSIKSYLEGLSAEIEKSIDFYQNINGKSSKVEKVILCGNGANLKGLVPYLVKRLGRKVIIGDPWINLNFGNNLPIINKEKSLQFSTAIGLAIQKKYGNKN